MDRSHVAEEIGIVARSCSIVKILQKAGWSTTGSSSRRPRRAMLLRPQNIMVLNKDEIISRFLAICCCSKLFFVSNHVVFGRKQVARRNT
jgi:hypothetical protein